MIFISGARQVGKTTIARTFQTSEASYLNWDNINHRQIILGNIFNYIESNLLGTLSKTKPCLIFDEIHKYKDWKKLYKGCLRSIQRNANYHCYWLGKIRCL